MTETERLTAFIEAQLQHDEDQARSAFGDHNKGEAEWTEIWSGAVQLGPHEDLVVTNDAPVSRHMVRHDPARVLRDVAATRRLVELAQEAGSLDVTVDLDRRVGARDLIAEPYIDDLILRTIASRWPDAAGYDSSWGPA